MIDIDPIAIATGGMWSDNGYVDIYGLVTWGMIVELAVAIDISESEESRFIYMEEESPKKRRRRRREEEEILEVIKLYVKIWH